MKKQTKGTHESSVGVLVRVHMLQVCVHVKHVVVLVVLLCVINSVVISVPMYSLFFFQEHHAKECQENEELRSICCEEVR